MTPARRHSASHSGASACSAASVSSDVDQPRADRVGRQIGRDRVRLVEAGRARPAGTPRGRSCPPARWRPPSPPRPAPGSRCGRARPAPAARRRGRRSPACRRPVPPSRRANWSPPPVLGTSRQRAPASRRRFRAKPAAPDSGARVQQRRHRLVEIGLVRRVGEDVPPISSADAGAVRRLQRRMLSLLRADAAQHDGVARRPWRTADSAATSTPLGIGGNAATCGGSARCCAAETQCSQVRGRAGESAAADTSPAAGAASPAPAGPAAAG